MSTITLIDEIAQLTAERDALELRIGAMIVERSDAFFKVIQERDALNAAAKLALNTIELINRQNSHEMILTADEERKCEKAINALKAVL